MSVVAEQTGWNLRAITPDSEIEGDLGCTGDDARELMLRMEREFGIDMSRVDFSRHFGSEASAGWPIVVAMVVSVPMSVLAMHGLGLAARALGLGGAGMLQGSWSFALVYLACCLVVVVMTKLVPGGRTRRVRRIPVTVQHLIDAARTRQWPNFGIGVSAQ